MSWSASPSLPFVSCRARSEIAGSGLQNPGESVGLRVPVDVFRKKFLWLGETLSHVVSKKL